MIKQKILFVNLLIFVLLFSVTAFVIAKDEPKIDLGERTIFERTQVRVLLPTEQPVPDLAIIPKECTTDPLEGYNVIVRLRIRNLGPGAYRPKECCRAFAVIYQGYDGWQLLDLAASKEIPALDRGESCEVSLKINVPNEGTRVAVIQWDRSLNNDRFYIPFVF